MNRKVSIGISNHLFNENGEFCIPGHGLKYLDDMPGVEWKIIGGDMSHVSPEQADGLDMIITLLSKVTAESLAGNERLLAVLCNAAGYDPVDVPALTEAGVAVCNTPKAVRRPMATAIITFILALSLRLPEKTRLAEEGRWAERDNYRGTGLVGKTLGSLGVGGIGHEMFRLAGAFGMKQIAYDPYLKPADLADVNVELVDLDRLLAESDFISISCPLNESTRHSVGKAELAKMKPTAYLINTSRGPVVDEAALIKALREKQIAGAAIDVFEQEPTPDDNPLLKMDNVIVTPHAIGSTDEIWQNKWDENISQVASIIKGEIPEALVSGNVWNQPLFQAKLKRFQEAIA